MATIHKLAQPADDLPPHHPDNRARIADLWQRYLWLYGDPEARIRLNALDVVKWHRLGRRLP